MVDRSRNSRSENSWRRGRGWLARAGRRAADVVPTTIRGALVLALAAVALWPFGFGDLDLVLFVVGFAGVVLAVLAVLLVSGAALVLRRRLRHASTEPLRLETGSLIRTGFRAPALSRLPLVRLRWRWLEPPGIEARQRARDGELVEEAIAHRRCEAPGVVRRFEVFDVFGLARVAFTRAETVPVLALPAVGRLRRMPVVQSIAANEGMPHPYGAPEGDRMEIRRYVPGDSVRHIMWKTYARTRELNVRLPELSVERAKKTVAYLVTGRDDEAAAAAARVALENGALGESWLFGTDGLAEPTTELESALRAIARSGSIGTDGDDGHGDDAPSSGLAAFLDRARRDGEIHCVVFAPARSDRWTDGALDALGSFGGSLSFILATDGVSKRQPRPVWRRLLFEPTTVDGTPADELSRVVRTLGGAGCVTAVVDRRSGRSFGEGYRRTLAGAPA